MGCRRGREDTRVTGMCREGERAPVSQEEEEAGWLLDTNTSQHIVLL